MDKRGKTPMKVKHLGHAFQPSDMSRDPAPVNNFLNLGPFWKMLKDS
jgi:hypothetical protein